jgi:cytochrome oxidase Cu insertion factor (SCO1/SenC/PrrC family)
MTKAVRLAAAVAVAVLGASMGLEGTASPQGRRAPELEGGVAWFNTKEPVTLAQLKGKIVLLDFWTYC